MTAVSRPSLAIPARYVPVARLGKGGGGEVWSVRDRATNREVALKVLADEAGEAEIEALVREAVALSGLEGLGVPRVIAFGQLPGSQRRYLVRELVDGRSLKDVLTGGDGGADQWLRPVAFAADQLTVLHRTGLLHGDIKPANIIVADDGTATLVDLGLAVPWRDGGTVARGLTPDFAAPELLSGAPLTVRAEVYSLGRTLEAALDARGRTLSEAQRAAVVEVAQRATRTEPQERFPSVDEFAIALKSAAHLTDDTSRGALAWPVLGDGAVVELGALVRKLAPGQAIAVTGARKSGRTTLVRRVSWSLGVSGAPVATIESPKLLADRAMAAELTLLELEPWKASSQRELVIVVDDLAELPARARETLRAAGRAGARFVAVGSPDDVAGIAEGGVQTFAVPPLDPASAAELVRRAIPSLPEKLAEHLLERVARSPGKLRGFVKRLGTTAITSVADVDEILDSSQGPASGGSVPRSRAELQQSLVASLETGRFEASADVLAALGGPEDDREAVDMAVARARIALARGDAGLAQRHLDGVADRIGVERSSERAWHIAHGRTLTRAGDFAAAAAAAERAVNPGDGELDALSADALAVRGVALAFIDDESAAMDALSRSVAVAERVGNPRVLAVAHGSLAIAHQRAGRSEKARHAHETALREAERAHDAWTIATTRLNLAGLAKADGDLAGALGHLEAAVDMGRRSGGHLVVQQALLNLANADLYVGRYARAQASLEGLAQLKGTLSPNARAQLLGLEAEHATRVGDHERGAHLFDLCADAYDAIGRPRDAAEARLEAILNRLASDRRDATEERRSETAMMAAAVVKMRERLGEGGFGEHEGLARMVEGELALARGDEAAARVALDDAYAQSMKAGQREWAWRALDARARVSAMQGSAALAKRDTEAALLLLEEIAAKLPRDLREVFWNDPRRRALRQTMPGSLHAVTSQASGGSHSSHFARSIIGAPTIARMGQNVGQSSHGRSSHGPLPAEDRLARIFEITRELASEHDLARLLVRVTDHAVGLLGAERGLIVLVNEDGQVVAHTARDAKGEEAAQNFSRSVAERVVRDGEPVIATSARDDQRLAEAVSVHQLMIQSIACVPIRGATPAAKTIGALYVETRLRPGTRFRDELPTLTAFADQAAIAIENARLIEENRRRADELAATNEELLAAKDKLAGLLGRRTEQLQTARRDLKQARAELRGHFGYAGLVGTSTAMRKLYALIERVKDADVPVLVTGESGTGKEVVAKAIHVSGERAKQPLLGVNCGAIPGNLLESELFGHVRGAFTGAERDRKGLFREAENGTLLLDEIGEMPLKMQASLLRVLQEKTVRPVGGVKEETCNARVVAATNRDLQQMVAEGTFREDLFYRLHVVELRIPPLRERSEDIPALIDHFLTLFASRHKRDRKTIARGAVRRLTAFDWPGNVRQLEHVLLNAWLLSDDEEIGEDDLDLPSGQLRAQTVTAPIAGGEASAPAMPRGAPPSGGTTSVIRARTQEQFRDAEKEQILAALTRCNWNRVQAAKLIGVPRRTFYRRLKEYGIV